MRLVTLRAPRVARDRSRPAWTLRRTSRGARGTSATVSRRPSSNVCRGAPAELAADLRRVDRVAPIVAGPIGHERLQRAIAVRAVERRVRRRRPQLVERVAQPIDDLRGSSARCRRRCCTSRPARPFSQHQQQAGAVILDVQPVAHVAAVAVDRQRTPLERVQDHQRNQLLRKLIRPVVVRAVRDEDRQPVGVEVGPHQVIGRRLARRVRRVRRVRRLLAEQAVGAERAVHLVGRHVQEAERCARSAPTASPTNCARRLEQHERADDVGVDERPRAVDRPIDVRLGRQVQDRASGRCSAKTRAIAVAIGDVGPHERHARIVERAARGSAGCRRRSACRRRRGDRRCARARGGRGSSR